jgi:hypothetical protein
MRAIIIALGLVVLAIGTATAAPSGVYVTLAAGTHAQLDSSERIAHVELIRRGLANHSALEGRNVDVTITKLLVSFVGNEVEIVAELGFVLSTANDQIVSIGNQTSKLRIARRSYNASKLQQLRRDVIEEALTDLRRKLRAIAARTV